MQFGRTAASDTRLRMQKHVRQLLASGRKPHPERGDIAPQSQQLKHE
jgi:hypothetical protein